MIKFKNFYAKFVKDFYSVFDANFSIDSHSILIEKNPCGNIAIFRTVSKIFSSYDGDVFIDEKNLKSINKKDLDVVYLPENPVLFTFKSIKYNLSFPLKIRKINKKIIKNHVNSVFFQYNLNNFKKKINKLSLSEKKIITLIRSLIRKPKYILLENFFENLEEKHISLALKILQEIKQYSMIIISEKNEENFKYFPDFKRIEI